MATGVQGKAAVRDPAGPGWRRRGPRAWLSGENVLAVVLFVVIFYVPYLTAGYAVFILPQYMLFGVLALTLCLLWGLGGMVSFGQGAFFSIGGYSLGIMIRDHAGASTPWLGLGAALVVGSLLAAAVGYFLFSANVRDSYFVLVTLALSTIMQVVANTESQLTGGFNGMFVKRVTLPLPGGGLSLSGNLSAYYLILGFTAAAYLFFRLLQRSAFGRVLVSIRENEERTRALGYNTALYKTVAFAVSGGVASLAGALYATDAGFISPDLGGVVFSTGVVTWVAIGGRRYFVGALVGALGISVLSNQLNAAIPKYWQLILGLLFVLVVTFFRRGVVGTLMELRGLRKVDRG
jgi:urea ABC transporter permease protein UrtC